MPGLTEVVNHLKKCVRDLFYFLFIFLIFLVIFSDFAELLKGVQD